MFNRMMSLCNKIKMEEQWVTLVSTILSPLQEKDFTSPGKPLLIIDTIEKIYQVKSSQKHPFMQQLFETIESTLHHMSR